MKRNYLLAIALVAFASSNAFSMEIVKGKLLQHKVWSTAKTKSVATFKETTFDKQKLAYLLNKHKDEGIVYVYAADRMNYITDSVTAGTTVGIGGAATAVVLNNTQDYKTYMVEQVVCYTPPASLGMCAVQANMIGLDAGGYFTLAQQPSWNITFETIGRNYVEIATEIRDLSEDNKTVFSSDDYQFINVEPAKR